MKMVGVLYGYAHHIFSPREYLAYILIFALLRKKV